MAHIVEETLDAWIDGTLSKSAADAVEDHLAECPACREKARELRLLCDALEALPGASGGEALAQATLDAWRREVRGESLLSLFRATGGLWQRLALGAVAAGLLVGLLLGRAAAPLMLPGNETRTLVALNDAGVGGAGDPYFQLLVMEEDL